MTRTEKYISRIRNPRKQSYARAYVAYLHGQGPEPRPFMIGTMAAQAVRQNVRLELDMDARA